MGKREWDEDDPLGKVGRAGNGLLGKMGWVRNDRLAVGWAKNDPTQR